MVCGNGRGRVKGMTEDSEGDEKFVSEQKRENEERLFDY